MSVRRLREWPYSRLWVPYHRGGESQLRWWWRHVTRFAGGLFWLATGQRMAITVEMRGVLVYGRRRLDGTRRVGGLFWTAPDEEWRERPGRYRLRGRWVPLR